MRLRSLAYFREVARCRSFTQAARNLYLSQQGLSKAVAELERKLGAPLLVRNARGISLTEEGELLLSFADDVAKAQDVFEARLDEMKSGRSPKSPFANASLVAMPYVCSSFLHVIERRAGKAVFDDLVIHENSLMGILEKIKLGEVDFALVNVLESSLKSLLEEDIVFVPIARAEILLLAADSLVSSLVAPVSPKALEGIPLAYYNEPVLNQFVECLGVKPRRVKHTSSIERITAAVSSGKAASFTDTLYTYAHPELEGASALPMATESGFCIGFLVNGKLGNGTYPYEFIEHFRAVFDRFCGDYAERYPTRP